MVRPRSSGAGRRPRTSAACCPRRTRSSRRSSSARELERLLPDRAPELHQLGAVLTLDRYALPIGRRLTVRYVEGDAGMRVLDRRALSAALRLCHAFVEAYAHLWRHIEQAGEDAWRVHAATVLVQLFRHRQQEFLLRLFRYKKRNSEQWRQLNEGYRYALACGVARERAGEAAGHDPAGGGRTLEREFIAILLLDALNTGQFSPRDLLRANALIGRWSDGLELRRWTSRRRTARPFPASSSTWTARRGSSVRPAARPAPCSISTPRR